MQHERTTEHTTRAERETMGRLAQLISRFADVMPLQPAYTFADRVGDLAYHLLPHYRQNVLHNVATAFDLSLDSPDVERIARQIFRTSARNFLDLLRVPSLSDAEIIRSIWVDPAQWATVESLQQQGRGAVVVTAHLGAFDYVGQLLAARRLPFVALTARTVPHLVDAAVLQLRSSRGLRLERVSPVGLRRAIQALRRGEFVGMVADHDFSGRGELVPFFGKATILPLGPVRLARAVNAPILAAFARRLARGYQLIIEPPFYVEQTADAQRDLRRALLRIATVLEASIRQTPGQWVTFQRVWPEQRPQFMPMPFALGEAERFAHYY